MKTLCSLLLSIICLSAVAQKSDSTRTYYRIIRGGLIEHATELKSKRYVKNGLSEIKSGKFTIAKGLYKDGERFGRWHFFKAPDSLEQIYNYATKKLEYNSTNKNIYCEIDSLKVGDNFTQAAKIGGYYTSLYFLKKKFSPSRDFAVYPGIHTVRLIFHIDQDGLLTKYETETGSGSLKKTEILDISKMREDDFKFIPAIVNGKPVKSRLIYENILTVD